MTGGRPLAITMGDASGVGPEIVLRRAVDGALRDGSAIVYGDAAILAHGADVLGLEVPIEVVGEAGTAPPRSLPVGPLCVLDLGRLGAGDHRPGVADRARGAAAREYVLAATDAALAGHVAAVVTMPMNKEATSLSDPTFVGHTELIAERCGARSVAMMLAAEHDRGLLGVAHVSTHCSLRDAIARVTRERVRQVIELTHQALVRVVERPRIAVCGLNPHAGEGGLFGSEDVDVIRPAVDAAVDAGVDATGPLPADTVFFRAVHRGEFDGVVVMYHDQGHAPMKLLAFERAVNATLGLPIVRTSVDHGTAFDIAWTGRAFTGSLDHAVAFARRLAGRSGSRSAGADSHGLPLGN